MLNRRASAPARQRPGAREIVEFAEAVGALLLAALAIAILPFRRLTRTIARPRVLGHAAERDRTVPAVTRAIERAARRLPLRIVCLHKALATHWMLRRRGIATHIHYGISPGGAALKAHVWVEAGGTIIMGAEESLGFAQVATFPATGNGENASG